MHRAARHKRLCFECGNPLRLERATTAFPESGLDGVTLVNVPAWRCDNGHEELEVPAIDALLDALAFALIRRPAPLTGREVRFLRKRLDLTSQQFARRLGMTHIHLSRIENGHRRITAQMDLLVRLYAAHAIEHRTGRRCTVELAGLLEQLESAPTTSMGLTFRHHPRKDRTGTRPEWEQAEDVGAAASATLDHASNLSAAGSVRSSSQSVTTANARPSIAENPAQSTAPRLGPRREGTSDVDLREQMDRLYREMSLADIPWNLDVPPQALVDLVASGRVAPCDAVDLGCGAGNYAVWLAGRGFRVTGIDVSEAAVAKAEALARARGVACRFLAHDVLQSIPELEASFDFAFDWEVLHHVLPEDRPRYAAAVHRLLRPGGTCFSVCFADGDPGLPGDGKYRRTQLGTVLYLSSEAELRELFEPLFVVEASGIIDVAGKRGPHRAVRMLMTKRE